MSELQIYGNENSKSRLERNKWQALRRGFGGHCPQCGEGRLLKGYIKPMETCSSCGEDLSHQRADDFPAYLCIFIIGHTLIPLLVAVYAWTDLNMWVQLAFFVPLTIVATLLLLPLVKGAVIGLQWALRMHGFGGEDDETFEGS